MDPLWRGPGEVSRGLLPGQGRDTGQREGPPAALYNPAVCCSAVSPCVPASRLGEKKRDREREGELVTKKGAHQLSEIR